MLLQLTSSSGSGCLPALNLSMPRRLICLFSSCVRREYSLYAATLLSRAASCSLASAIGSFRCASCFSLFAALRCMCRMSFQESTGTGHQWFSESPATL